MCALCSGKALLTAWSLQDGILLSESTWNAVCLPHTESGCEWWGWAFCLCHVSACKELTLWLVSAFIFKSHVSSKGNMQGEMQGRASVGPAKSLCGHIQNLALWALLSPIVQMNTFPWSWFSGRVRSFLFFLGLCWEGSLAAEDGRSKTHALISP